MWIAFSFNLILGFIFCWMQEEKNTFVFAEGFEEIQLEGDVVSYIDFDLSDLTLMDIHQKTASFSPKPAQGVTSVTLKSEVGWGTFEFLPYLGFHQSTTNQYVGVSTYSQGINQPTFHTKTGNLAIQNVIYRLNGKNLTIELIGSPFGNRIEQWSFTLPQEASAYQTTREFYRGYCDEEKKAVYEVHNLRYQVYDDSYNVAVECAPGNEDETIVIPAYIDINGYRYRVTDIGHRRTQSPIYPTFSKAYHLKKVIVEEGLLKINTKAFIDCSLLEEVVLPDTIQEIGPYAFSQCSHLKSIKLPSKLKEIQCSVFSGCSSLYHVELPEELQSIQAYAFENCKSLTKIQIPASVQIIEGNENLAFYGDFQLTIYGKLNSVAQTYAQKHGIPFVEILPSNLNKVYRLYNTQTGEHLYTTQFIEQQACLQNPIWKDEGHGWLAPSSSDFPIYRVYNPNTTDHHYTMDQNEYEVLQNIGWKGEGIVFYSTGSSGSSLYRLYNPNAKGAGSHHYTLDETERNELVKLGWKEEGIAWHVLN